MRLRGSVSRGCREKGCREQGQNRGYRRAAHAVGGVCGAELQFSSHGDAHPDFREDEAGRLTDLAARFGCQQELLICSRTKLV